MFERKILCIGNETEQTDVMVSELAAAQGTQNHGLISQGSFVPQHTGYYHTSIADIPPGEIVINLAGKFDSIVMLDQNIDSYPHWKSFVNTFRLMVDLEHAGFIVDYKNNPGNKNILYWHNLLRTNKSICAYPFVALSNDYGYATLCCKNGGIFTVCRS